MHALSLSCRDVLDPTTYSSDPVPLMRSFHVDRSFRERRIQFSLGLLHHFGVSHSRRMSQMLLPKSSEILKQHY
jgi:hypothetical protein